MRSDLLLTAFEQITRLVHPITMFILDTGTSSSNMSELGTTGSTTLDKVAISSLLSLECKPKVDLNPYRNTHITSQLCLRRFSLTK